MKQYTVYSELEDKVYEKKLLDFLSRRYGHLLRLIPVHPKEENGEDPQEEKGIYLYDRELSEEEEIQKRLLYGRLVRVSPEEGIDPYQSADGIARKILGYASSLEDNKTPEVSRAKGKAVVLYSACGGVGVSTLALCLATRLGKKGKTLFLPLGRNCGESLFIGKELESSFSDLLYSFLAEPQEVFSLRLEDIPQKVREGFFAARPLVYPEDLEMLTASELAEFVDQLKKAFSFVVLDAGTLWGKSARELLELCDERIEILDLSEAGQAKREGVKDWLREEAFFFSRGKEVKEKRRGFFAPEEKTLEGIPLPPPEVQKTEEGWLEFKEACAYVEAVDTFIKERLSEDDEQA